MANITLIKIGGNAIQTPSSYSAQTSTIVSGGRNVKGVYVGNIVREDIAKISLTWKFIEPSAWAYIIKLFSTTYGGSFIQSVYFLNQDTGEYETRDFYVSDRKADILMFNDDGTLKGYQNATLNLVEV